MKNVYGLQIFANKMEHESIQSSHGWSQICTSWHDIDFKHLSQLSILTQHFKEKMSSIELVVDIFDQSREVHYNGILWYVLC